MTTRRLDLDVQWQQITDGSGHAFMQVLNGVVYLTDSDALPDNNAPVHPLIDCTINIDAPVKAWVRSGPDSGARVIITSWN